MVVPSSRYCALQYIMLFPAGPAVPTTLVGAPTQVPTLRVTPVPTHQHMAPSQAAAAAAAVRGWAAVAVPAGSGLSDSLGIPGLPSDWSTPPDGMSAGPEATGSSRTCSSGAPLHSVASQYVKRAYHGGNAAL